MPPTHKHKEIYFFQSLSVGCLKVYRNEGDAFLVPFPPANVELFSSVTVPTAVTAVVDLSADANAWEKSLCVSV